MCILSDPLYVCPHLTGSVTLLTGCFQVIVPLPEIPLYFPVPDKIDVFPGLPRAAKGLLPLDLQKIESPFSS